MIETKNPHRLLPVNTPSISGRIYPEAECQKVIDEINGDTQTAVVVDFPEDGRIWIERIAGWAENARIEDGWVVFDYCGAKTEKDNIVQVLWAAEVELNFRPFGIGNVSQDRIVSDYEFSGIAIVSVPAERLKPPKPVEVSE